MRFNAHINSISLQRYHRGIIESKVPIFLIYIEGNIRIMELQELYHYRDIIEISQNLKVPIFLIYIEGKYRIMELQGYLQTKTYKIKTIKEHMFRELRLQRNSHLSIESKKVLKIQLYVCNAIYRDIMRFNAHINSISINYIAL